ncbi:MAG: hypothetical protein LBD57_05900 [Endomicrobium sp.]|nr:hypothetical protein [Endomicrobium sp.]
MSELSDIKYNSGLPRNTLSGIIDAFKTKTDFDNYNDGFNVAIANISTF